MAAQGAPPLCACGGGLDDGFSLGFFAFFSLKSIDFKKKKRHVPPPPAPPALFLSPSHARDSRILARLFRGGRGRSERASNGAENATALSRHRRPWPPFHRLALSSPSSLFSQDAAIDDFSPSRALSPLPPNTTTTQVRASAEQPKAVAAVPNKAKQALAAAALALAVGVTATPAFADVSGLTPCSQSKQYASRQKKEVKALQKRLKQVSGDGNWDERRNGSAK